MDQESDLQPADEGLPQRDLEHASDFDTEVVREEKEELERLREEALEALLAWCMEVPRIELEEALLERARKEAQLERERKERERKEALERERKEALERAFMEVLWIELKEAPEREEFRNLNCMSDEFEKALARMRKEAPKRNLMEALERKLKEVPKRNLMEAPERKVDFLGREKIERIGGSPFYSDIRDEDIVNKPMHDLHALLKEKSLPDSLRDKIKGELAVRCIEVKGKATAISSYDTGESSTNTSSQSSPSANTSGSSLNDHTQGTTVSTSRGSPESTVQRYPLPHPPLTASRNEQARLHEAIAKCRDNRNVRRAGTTVYSSEPMDPCQQSAAYAPIGVDIEAGRAGTTVFSSEPKAPYLQSAAYALAGADIGAGRAGTTVLSEPTAPYQQSAAYLPDSADIEVGRTATAVFSSQPTAHYLRSAAYAPASVDIKVGRAGTTVFSSEPTAHSQQSAVYAPSGADIGAGRAGTTVFSLEPTSHYHQSPAYAPNGADIEAGAFTTCSDPPPETIAIFKEPPAVILIAGAFALLSRNPETFRGPVERVLLAVMTVGFICSFMWPLMGGRRRMAGVSSLLQWTAVWAMFLAFFLIMTLLITH